MADSGPIDRRRVLAEVRRQLGRRGTLRIIAGYAFLFAVFALLGLQEEGMDLPIEIGYYLAPLFMAPIAAHRIGRDRDAGLTDVHATTPLTRGERLAGQTLAVLAIPPLAIAATLPTLYGLSAVAAPGAFWTLLVHVPWTLTFAIAAASTGLLVGYLLPGRPRLGLALAFGLVVVWFVAGVNLNDIPDPGLFVALLGKLSPYTYADSATPLGPVPSGPITMLVGPLILAVTAFGMLVPIARSLQHPTGWRTPIAQHPGAILAVAGMLVVGLGVLAAWEMPENPWGTQTPAQPIEDTQAGIEWQVVVLPGEGDGTPWREGWGPDTPLRMRIQAIGEPNETVRLDDLSLSSEKIRFGTDEPLPERIVLDSTIPPSDGSDQRRGIGDVTINWTGHPRELYQTAPVELTFAADGEPVRFDVSQSALSWRVDDRWVLAGSLASLLPSLAAARWLPLRWNRW